MNYSLSNMLSSVGSGFNPLILNPAVWFDGSDASTMFDSTTGGSLVTPGNPIARWEDKSGNARHITQATLINRPTRIAASQNGRDIVRFDGANDFLQITNNFLDNLSGLTIFIVNKWQLNISGTGILLSYGQAGSNNTDILYGSAPERAAQVNNGNDATGYFSSTAPSNHVIETMAFDGTKTGNTNRLRIISDGITQSLIYTDTVPSLTASPTSPSFMIGGYFPFPTNFYYLGDIAEIIVLPYAANPDQITRVNSYLKSKWATA